MLDYDFYNNEFTPKFTVDAAKVNSNKTFKQLTNYDNVNDMVRYKYFNFNNDFLDFFV